MILYYIFAIILFFAIMFYIIRREEQKKEEALKKELDALRVLGDRWAALYNPGKDLHSQQKALDRQNREFIGFSGNQKTPWRCARFNRMPAAAESGCIRRCRN